MDCTKQQPASHLHRLKPTDSGTVRQGCIYHPLRWQRGNDTGRQRVLPRQRDSLFQQRRQMQVCSHCPIFTLYTKNFHLRRDSVPHLQWRLVPRQQLRSGSHKERGDERPHPAFQKVVFHAMKGLLASKMWFLEAKKPHLSLKEKPCLFVAVCSLQ